jgi:hypothetical protein
MKAMGLHIIRYVLIFLLLYFLDVFIYSFSHVHIYILAFDPQINTSVIYNMIYRVIN